MKDVRHLDLGTDEQHRAQQTLIKQPQCCRKLSRESAPASGVLRRGLEAQAEPVPT